MAEPRTMRDVRSLRKMSPPMGLRREKNCALELHRLAGERKRLVREMELSRQRQLKIELRLREVVAQIGDLEGLTSPPIGVGIERPLPAEGRRPQLTVEY